MIINIKKNEIINGLHKATNIIPQKTGTAYLRCIWLIAKDNKLKIMSSDGNIEISGEYSADVLKEGLVGLNGRAFFDLISRFPGQNISLKLDNGNKVLFLEQEKRSYKIPVVPADWFQEHRAFPNENNVTWSADFLAEIFDKVLFCVSDDKSSDALNCVLFKKNAENIDVCGLNGSNFAHFNFINDELAKILPEDGLLIQKRYTQELRKWLGTSDIEFAISNGNIFVKSGSAESNEIFSCQYSQFKYPNYLAFLARIDGDYPLMKVNRVEFKSCLDRISTLFTDDNRNFSIALKNKEAILSALNITSGSAKEHLEIDYLGDITEIAFPSNQFMAILDHFSSEIVDITFSGLEEPCAVRGTEDNNYLVIIMPMKINTESSYYDNESE